MMRSVFAIALAEREDAYRETVRERRSDIKIALDREMLSIRCKP